MTSLQDEQRVPAEQSGSVPCLIESTLTDDMIRVFFDSYNSLRYGFVESVYCESMARRLRRLGHEVRREAPLDVWDNGERVGHFRVDLLVDRRLIAEVKAGPALDPFAERQILNYLRCSDLSVGLILYFGPKPRFKRLVNSVNKNRVSARDS